MLRCCLCGPVSRNPVDFEISYGALDKLLQVCRWCKEDLELFGFRSNQVVYLPRVLQDPRLPLTEVFGAAYGLVVAGWKVSGAASLFNAIAPGMAHAAPEIIAQCAGAASPIHESATTRMEAEACL